MLNISLKSPAKINLSLDVTDVTPTGYHLLNMIVSTIDIFDYINIYITKSKNINIYNTGLPSPKGPDNIIYKSVKAFFDYTNAPFNGVDIEIKKNIPTQAGLGGGSSNAATTLIGLNQLFNTKLSTNDLKNIGLKLGADVPLFFYRGLLQCQGIGEIITQLLQIQQIFFVVIKPQFSFSTAEIYKKLDCTKIKKHPDTNKIIAGVYNNDIKKICGNLYNVLEECIDNPKINDIKKLLISHGALTASMTGSGSAVFGVFNNKNKAEISANILTTIYPHVFLSKTVYN